MESPLEQHGEVPNEPSRDKTPLRRTKTTLDDFDPELELRRAVSTRQRIWTLMEEPSLHPVSLVVHYIFSFIVITSVAINIILTLPKFESSKPLLVLELIINILFTAEVLLRASMCPTPRRLLLNPYMWIDGFAVLPVWIALILGIEPTENPFLEFVMLLVPILRLLKITRHSSGCRLLVISIQDCAAPLTVPAFLLLLVTVFFSCVIFWIEKHTADEETDGMAFETIPHVIWFVIVTISTVGFGDVSPNSESAKMATCILILFGVCYMAMPMAIIGGTFSRVWSERDKILIAEKAKAKMADGGFTKEDLKELFMAADSDGSGHISRKEFVRLIQCFHLGFTHAQAIKLFKSIDEDRTGLVSYDEFCEFLFPDIAASMEEAMEMEMQKEMQKAMEMQKAESERADRQVKHAQDFLGELQKSAKQTQAQVETGSLRATANAGDASSSSPTSPKRAEQSHIEHLQPHSALEPQPPGIILRVHALEDRMGDIEHSILNLQSEHQRQFELLFRKLSPSKDQPM